MPVDDRGDLASCLGPEPVGREVNEDGDEVAIEVDAGEDADGAVVGAVDDELGQRQQVGGRGLQQLVARQGAQRREQPPAGVTFRPDSGAVQDLADAPAHDRDTDDRVVLGVGDQAEEHVDALRDRVARRGDHGDAVVVCRAAHRRHERRFEDHQRRAGAVRGQQFQW